MNEGIFQLFYHKFHIIIATYLDKIIVQILVLNG